MATETDSNSVSSFRDKHLRQTATRERIRKAFGPGRLYDKHFPPASEPGGLRNKSHEAVFLFDVDNTGSILLSEWPASVRTDFLAWLAANYQKVTVRETIITNYLVDGEDWLRRMRDNYIEYIES